MSSSALAADAAGIGLRAEHQRRVLEEAPRLDFVELLVDNHLASDGPVLEAVETLCSRSPVAFHSTCFSLGGVDPLPRAHLLEIRALVERFRPAVLSDHLCFGAVDGVHGHDLLPLPMSRATVRHVVDRVREAQDLFGRRIALENVSAYVRTVDDELSEAAFLAEIADGADAEILFDVNNAYVNARNFGDEPRRFLEELPGERIVQYHLGGHTDLGTHVIDSHSAPVVDAVAELFVATVERFGPRPTIVEWDTELPELEVLLAERDRAASLLARARPRRSA